MQLIARFKPGKDVPVFAATLIRGGHFVKITGPKTASGDYSAGEAALGDRIFGVAEYDSGPTTQDAHSVERRVNVTRRGSIARVVPGGNITAGDLIISDAQGRALTYDSNTAHIIAGIAVETKASTDDFVEVDLF